jgi:hypothetical protein
MSSSTSAHLESCQCAWNKASRSADPGAVSRFAQYAWATRLPCALDRAGFHTLLQARGGQYAAGRGLHVHADLPGHVRILNLCRSGAELDLYYYPFQRPTRHTGCHLACQQLRHPLLAAAGGRGSGYHLQPFANPAAAFVTSSAWRSGLGSAATMARASVCHGGTRLDQSAISRWPSNMSPNWDSHARFALHVARHVLHSHLLRHTSAARTNSLSTGARKIHTTAISPWGRGAGLRVRKPLVTTSSPSATSALQLAIRTGTHRDNEELNRWDDSYWMAAYGRTGCGSHPFLTTQYSGPAECRQIMARIALSSVHKVLESWIPL